MQNITSLHLLSACLVCFSCGFSHVGYAAACDTIIDSNIKNSCLVEQNVLWRGAKPNALAAASLIAHGVKTVVNLELLHDDLNAFTKANINVVEPQQIQYFRIRDWEPLVVLSRRQLDNHLAQFIAITRTQPAPIYVHCRSGRNRTGVMVAAYKVFNGTPIEDAIADMKRYKGEWFKQDAKYIRSLTPERLAALEDKVTVAQENIEKVAEINCAGNTCTTVKE